MMGKQISVTREKTILTELDYQNPEQEPVPKMSQKLKKRGSVSAPGDSMRIFTRTRGATLGREISPILQENVFRT
jgi:hypothetical protein